ncbi:MULTISPECIES: hypothetical protein [Streptomyces]|nr:MULTISPECIES: hypothetical protein [Streptomyces]
MRLHGLPSTTSPSSPDTDDNLIARNVENIGHYIRLTPDNRLAFGGRA